MRLEYNYKDLLFIIFFSVLIFFAAFFIFSAVKKNKEPKRISIRELERTINDKVNSRIHKLEGKNILLQSKLSRFKYSRLEEKAKVTVPVEQHTLEIYKKQDHGHQEVQPKSASDQVAMLAYEEDQLTKKESLLKQYKQELRAKALKAGWVVEINDQLEITSAKPLDGE